MSHLVLAGLLASIGIFTGVIVITAKSTTNRHGGGGGGTPFIPKDLCPHCPKI